MEEIVKIIASEKWFGREEEVFTELRAAIADAIVPVMSVEESDKMTITVKLTLDEDKVRNRMLEFLN